MIYASILAILVLAGGQNQRDITQQEIPVTFSTRVNLVNVPVVVRDKNGRAIGNLTKDNFQLYDRGKLQVISKFAVEKAGERAATMASHLDDDTSTGSETTSVAKGAIPSRYVAYVFDNAHMDPGDLAQARAAAIRHLEKSLLPTDRVAMFSTSGSNAVDFTDDREALRAELNKVLPRMPPVTALPISLNQYYGMAVYPQGAQGLVQDAITSMNLDKSNSPMGAASAQLAQIAVANALQSIAVKEQTVTAISLSVLDHVVRRMATLPGERIIVLVSSGFLMSDTQHNYDMSDTEAATIDRAIKARITINSFDARGLYVTVRGGDATTTSRSNDSSRLEEAGAEIASSGPADLADGTGGTFFHNRNDFDEGFKLLAGAPEYEYILGFSPQNLKLDGAFHQLKVVVTGKGLSSQARRGYYAPRRDADAAAQALAEIREALFSREELLEIPCEMQTQFFKMSPGVNRLSVLAKVDLHSLPFRKTEGRNLDTLTIVTGIFDRNGNLLKGTTKTVDLHVQDELFQARLAAGLAAKTSFDVQPGKYVLRLVVRDSEGQSMSARNSVVDIP